MEISFNGIDRLYDAYSWRLTRRAKEAWRSGIHVKGLKLKELEVKMASKYQRKFAVGVGSATDGIFLALKSLGLNSTHTVICPVYSYIATAGAIRRLGCKIHFVDVDERGNIGPIDSTVQADAVVYVNLFGNTANYPRLKKFCDEKKIPLIEDASQSQGAWHHGQQSGMLGNVSIFSFDPMKNMPCFGTAGMVLTDDTAVYQDLISYRRHGIHGNHEFGYNSIISEDHANQLIFLLSKFDKLQKMREKIFERYKKNLPKNTLIESYQESGIFSSHHKCVIVSNKRDLLQKYLKDAGVETKIHYEYLLDKDPTNHYPRAEQLLDTALSLPIYPFLRMSEVDYICERINQFYGV
jgi:dTDP-4-amino-4,6-dideoxygalactose transaminase